MSQEIRVIAFIVISAIAFLHYAWFGILMDRTIRKRHAAIIAYYEEQIAEVKRKRKSLGLDSGQNE